MLREATVQLFTLFYHDSTFIYLFNHDSTFIYLLSGKTHLLNFVIDWLRAQGKGAIVAAASGVAALELRCGRTAHSTFRIPTKNVDANMKCDVSRQAAQAQLIQDASLIIWDEVRYRSIYISSPAIK